MRHSFFDPLVLLFSLALAVFGFWRFRESRVPMPAAFAVAAGRVAHVEASRGRGINELRIWLSGTPEPFPYPDFLPRRSKAQAELQPGRRVEIQYTTGRSGSLELWGLAIEGVPILAPQEAHAARRREGVWGLAFGVTATLCLAALLAVPWAGRRRVERGGARTPASPRPRKRRAGWAGRR